MSGYFGGKAYGHPRPAKLNEKKSYSEEEKKQRGHFLLEEQHEIL